jgi:bifunctional non-homologous end joining protein LigD
MRSIAADLAKLARIQRPIKEKPLDDARTVWVEPKLTCEVQFSSITDDGLLREGVFLRMRPDLTVER